MKHVKVGQGSLLSNLFGGTKFMGVRFSNPSNVSICNNYHVYNILSIRGKFSRWGKNSLGRVKIQQVGTKETVKCVGYNS